MPVTTYAVGVYRTQLYLMRFACENAIVAHDAEPREDPIRIAPSNNVDARRKPVLSRNSILAERAMTIWDQVLETLRSKLPDEDFRRWFGNTAYASDSGDQVTVWVSTESIRRHIVAH